MTFDLACCLMATFACGWCMAFLVATEDKKGKLLILGLVIGCVAFAALHLAGHLAGRPN